MTTQEVIDRFTQAMREAGIETEAAIQADGQRHRFRVVGDKAGSENGWYVLHMDGVPAGAFGCWKRGVNESWCAKSASNMTDSERKEHIARMEASKRQHEAEQAQLRNECKAKAERLWSSASETVSADHGYLTAKGVKAYGLRQLREALLVPVRADAGGIVGLQFIQPDGTKRFLTGTPKAGSYHRITGDLSRVLVCEGYATGASLHEATGYAVAIAFDAGNLMPVAKALKEKLPDAVLVLCADDDRATSGNVGMMKAQAAALAVDGLLACPTFSDSATGTDFNDMHQLSGLDAVRGAVEAATAPQAENLIKPNTESLTKPNIDEAAISTGIATSEDVQESESAMITRLASLSDLAYFRVQKASAAALGISVSQLDKLKNKEQARNSKADANSGSGTALTFEEIEAWPEAVDGAELLDDITATINRFVICEPYTSDAAALWLMFTWLIDAVTVAPIANITAPLPNCGKSTMLDLFELLVFRPLKVDHITSAAIFRSIDRWNPTLLIDEVDAFLKANEEARGILNSGHKPNGKVGRVVGDNHEVRNFSTWGAKALCGIGSIASTLHSRSIRLELRRKLSGESVENLRHANKQQLNNLVRRMARFAEDVNTEIRVARPAPISSLNNRAQDNWEPLLAIADAAGGTWPERARNSAQQIASKEAINEATDVGTELLTDIRAAFERLKVSRVSSSDLLNALCQDEEARWATYDKGKPMTPRQLAKRLKDFGIVSGSIRLASGQTPKGYYLDKFNEVFTRYLPVTLHLSATTPQTSNGAGFSHIPIRHNSDNVADKKTLKASNGEGCGGVADKSLESGKKVSGSDVTAWDEGEI